MAELTEEEKLLLELMKREEARQDAIPESERPRTTRPDRFNGPVGADEEGRMFERGRPAPSPEEEKAHYQDLIRKLEEKDKRGG